MVSVLFTAISPVPRTVPGIQSVLKNDCSVVCSDPSPFRLHALCFSSTSSSQLLEWALIYNLFMPTFIQQISTEFLFCDRHCARSRRYSVNKTQSYTPVGRECINPAIRLVNIKLHAVTNAMRGLYDDMQIGFVPE